MKTKTFSNFGIIFAVALTMVTTAVFTACNSEDDFGGDFNGDITGEYSLATRMMTRAGENNNNKDEEEEDKNKQYEDTITFRKKVDFTFKVYNNGGSYIGDITESEYYNFTLMTELNKKYVRCDVEKDNTYQNNYKINLTNSNASIYYPRHIQIILEAEYDNTFGYFPHGFTFSKGTATIQHVY
jgi:hypothetical protein